MDYTRMDVIQDILQSFIYPFCFSLRRSICHFQCHHQLRNQLSLYLFTDVVDVRISMPAAHPPGEDGGYGWIIVLASWCSHLLLYGISWNVGIFYVVFLEHIDGSAVSLALASSLNTATSYGIGKATMFFSLF